ncbi:MAG: tRNA (adenosine(37)-N6)-dimethylallyltransferase MiaA [Candidatus Woykebacteria bacterium]
MKKLLVIVGPTGTGKTDLAIKLAKKFNGEVVSADSRQIYTGMDIGTGKMPGNSELKKHGGHWVIDGIPIHLYDIVTPDKTFSVAEYQQRAYEKISDIQNRGKLPILVGGTGLYVRAVVQGLKLPQVAPDPEIRDKLGRKHLWQLLKELEEVDHRAFQKIDKKNPRRVIRALEIYLKTGKTVSELAKKYQPDFEILIIGLTSSRELLYERADKRIEEWFKSGFVEEVGELLKKHGPSLPSMSALGYSQIVSYLDRKTSLEEVKRRIKFDHHGFIRRQLTWFKKEPNINWFDISESSFVKEILAKVTLWLNDG